jgi:hypothetical protein
MTVRPCQEPPYICQCDRCGKTITTSGYEDPPSTWGNLSAYLDRKEIKMWRWCEDCLVVLNKVLTPLPWVSVDG